MELSLNQINKAFVVIYTMQLLDYEQILPYEQELLSSEGISLANFADRNNKQNVFQKKQTRKVSDHHQFRMVNIVAIKDNINSNFQALVIAFLRCIFENSKNSDLLDHIKCSIYHKDLTFTKLQNVQLQSLTDLSIKKMLAEFFQLLTFGNYQDKVIVKLTKYPIVINILTSYFRVVLACLDFNQANDGKNKLQTKQIYETLFQYFDINFKIIDDIYLLLDDGVFITYRNEEYLVGDFIENIQKKSEPSQDGCSSDQQLFAFVKPNDVEKNIMAINQIDQDFSEQQIGNSTPSFVTTQSLNFQKKKNLQNEEAANEINESPTPSFAKINKQEINFKPKVKISQCQAIRECQIEEDMPPQMRVRTRTIDVHHFWQANMHDSQGSELMQSNHQSVIETGLQNPQNMNLPLLEKSYRIHCQQKASKPQTPPPLIHKRNKSQSEQILYKKECQPKTQKKDLKPPPSFLFASKKQQSPQKIQSPRRQQKKDLLELAKQQKTTNKANNKKTENTDKWLPFMYNKKKETKKSQNNKKNTSQILVKKRISLNYNNASNNSYERILTNSHEHQYNNVCSMCTRKIPKNQIYSSIVNISIAPQYQQHQQFQHPQQNLYQMPLKKTITNHSPSPKKTSYIGYPNEPYPNINKFYNNGTKILAKTSAIYGTHNNGQFDQIMVHSSPINNNTKVIFNYPKNLYNRTNQGRTSAIYPPNSMYY